MIEISGPTNTFDQAIQVLGGEIFGFQAQGDCILRRRGMIHLIPDQVAGRFVGARVGVVRISHRRILSL